MFFSRTLSVGRWKILIIPKTRLPSAEPIINQQGFRSCSIALFFEINTSPPGRHVTTGKRWHRVLETTRKSSAGASRSTPQFHVKNGMTRWMKTGNSRRWAPHLWFAIKNVSGDLRIYVAKMLIFHSYILKVLKSAQYF